MATSCNVRVIARFRPFNQRELGLGCDKVHTIQGSQRVDIQCDGHPKRSFAFDQVFGEDSRQRDVYSILQVRHTVARAPPCPALPSEAQAGRELGRELCPAVARPPLAAPASRCSGAGLAHGRAFSRRAPSLPVAWTPRWT